MNGSLWRRRKKPRRWLNLISAAAIEVGSWNGAQRQGRPGPLGSLAGERRFFAMTIGKKLYVGFGSILGVLVALLLVNIVAGIKESSARKDAATALESFRAVKSVHDQIMLNRLSLNNFLLSGDPRDEEKVTRGLQDVNEIMKRGESQAGSELLRAALIQVEGTRANWADNSAKPLLAKRHQVDSGDATVSDLQIFYLQKDPASWLAQSASVLDQSNGDITKALDQSTKSPNRTVSFSTY